MSFYLIVNLMILCVAIINSDTTHKGRAKRSSSSSSSSDSYDNNYNCQSIKQSSLIETQPDVYIYAETYNLNLYNSNNKNTMPLFFIHGLPLSSNSWKDWIHTLWNDYHQYKNRPIILVDFRGSGNSQLYKNFQGGINNYWSISNLTYDLIQVLNYYNIHKAIWIGFSTGGVITINAAINYSSYVDKLALISSGPRLDPSSILQLQTVISALTSISRDSFIYSFISNEIELQSYIDNGLINKYYGYLSMGDFYKLNFEALQGIFADGLAQAQYQNNQITQKGFIVHGANDQLFLESTQNELKAMFINNNYEFYEYDSKHGVMFEYKDEILPNFIKWVSNS